MDSSYFYLDTREPPSKEKSKEFLERIDPDREQTIAKLRAEDRTIEEKQATEGSGQGI